MSTPCTSRNGRLGCEHESAFYNSYACGQYATDGNEQESTTRCAHTHSQKTTGAVRTTDRRRETVREKESEMAAVVFFSVQPEKTAAADSDTNDGKPKYVCDESVRVSVRTYAQGAAAVCRLFTSRRPDRRPRVEGVYHVTIELLLLLLLVLVLLTTGGSGGGGGVVVHRTRVKLTTENHDGGATCAPVCDYYYNFIFFSFLFSTYLVTDVLGLWLVLRGNRHAVVVFEQLVWSAVEEPCVLLRSSSSVLSTYDGDKLNLIRQ